MICATVLSCLSPSALQAARRAAPNVLLALAVSMGTGLGACSAPATPGGRAVPANALPVTAGLFASPEAAPGDLVRFDDGLTWTAAREAALRHDPSLLAQEAAVDVLDAQVNVSNQRRNPSLEIQTEDLGADGGFAGPNGGQTTVAFSQVIERGGKRAARRRLSEAELKAARTRLLLQRADVVANARKLFLEALAAQEALAACEQTLQQLESFHGTVSARVDAGKASGLDREHLALLASQAGFELERASQRARLAHAQLAQLWDGRVSFDEVSGQWPATVAPPPLPDLASRWSGSVGQERLELELAIGDAAVDAAASGRRQDWEVSAGLRRREATDDWTALVGIDLPLPIFNNGRAALEVARARRRQSIHRRDAARRESHAALARLHGQLTASHATWTAIADGAFENAEWLYTSTRKGYEQGRFGLLRVLESQAALQALRTRQREAQLTHHAAWAELAALLGEPVPEAP